MRCLIGFLLSLTFLGSAAVTLAGELTSPKGFAITYPDEWTPATKEQLDEMLWKEAKSARRHDLWAPPREVRRQPEYWRYTASHPGQCG